MAHLGRFTRDPRQGFNLGGGFGYRRGRLLLEIGLQRRAVGLQLTLWPIMIETLELLDPTSGVRGQIAMEAGFRDPTQPHYLAIGDPLTTQVQGFQPHLHAGIGMMETPVPQGLNVVCAKGNLEHGCTPWLKGQSMLPLLAQDSPKVLTRPVRSIGVTPSVAPP